MPQGSSRKIHDPAARRIVLLVLDGLRADLVGDPRFPHLAALLDESAFTLDALTVLPSVTAVAMTSLLSGLAPVDHRVDSDRFRVPAPRVPLRPISRVILDAGMPAAAVLRQVPWMMRPIASNIVGALGLTKIRYASANAHALLAAALPLIRTQPTGLILLHWPDCDDIGHRTGWMSAAYLAAVTRMDHALGVLRGELERSRHDTTLILLSDHGGGGRVATHHDSAHPYDCTIPILISGAGVRRTQLPTGLSLLDVPPTVLWALGLNAPAEYAGTALTEAFDVSRSHDDSILVPTGADERSVQVSVQHSCAAA